MNSIIEKFIFSSYYYSSSMKTIHLLEFYINFLAQAERDNFIHSQIGGGGRDTCYLTNKEKSLDFLKVFYNHLKISWKGNSIVTDGT